MSSSGAVTSSTSAATTTSTGGDGILVDLLETEVDSLKAQLEKTQNDLVRFNSFAREKKPLQTFCPHIDVLQNSTLDCSRKVVWDYFFKG